MRLQECAALLMILIPAGLSFFSVTQCNGEEALFSVASWPEQGRGNARALVRVTAKADAVYARIPWRRRDAHPERKAILVFDAATGEQVKNVAIIAITREYGEIVFQPATAPGTYEIYYLPHTCERNNFGDPGTYLAPKNTADPKWLSRNHLAGDEIRKGAWKKLPRAKIVAIQFRGAFQRFDPMEIIATQAETKALLARHPNAPYLLFTEDRRHPIRMFDDLPLRWIERGPSRSFRGEAQPGEFYVFQIGVFAARRRIDNVTLRFGDLKTAEGKTIPGSAFTCFNLEGTDWLGRPMKKTFALAKGKVRPLWIGAQIPKDAAGTYAGVIEFEPAGLPRATIQIRLKVAGAVLPDGGVSDTWRMARLKWLNSTLGLDDDVIPPYTPLIARGNVVECLNRKIVFNGCGLPNSIRSNGREILAGPVEFIVEMQKGRARWTPRATRFLKVTPGVVVREASSDGGALRLTVRSKMEFDGCVTFRATLKALKTVDIQDVRLLVPIRREIAKYMMGMSRRGSIRPKTWTWKWDIDRADNMVWIGDVPAGFQLKLLGPRDVWTLSSLRGAGLPESWSNRGQGGSVISEKADRVLIRVFSGKRRLDAGRALAFRFRFLVTPFKPIDPQHWNWRYGDVHSGANILHLHHATNENPYINYPFLTVDKIAALVKSVKAIRFRETRFGELTYPAKGNIDLRRGALSLWVRIEFDPKAGQAGNSRFNQPLFFVNFPNEDQIGFYWNVDDRGMRAYVRKGPPGKNQYPVLICSHSPDWRRGQRHVVTLSWGERFSISMDGKRLASAPYRGTLADDPKDAAFRLAGRGFTIDAIKISSAPIADGERPRPIVDKNTLFLDTFARWDGGPETRPEKIADNAHGTIVGVVRKLDGPIGPALLPASRREPIPPDQRKGVNIYYTVRELSNHVAEMWALRSLGDEVFQTGGVDIYNDDRSITMKADGGDSWLKEHLVTGYIPAWRQPLPDDDTDAAIATQGLSRWHNFYIEGLAWLMKTTGVDGLYLDGIGYDREIMKRVAKTMYRINPRSRINFHSGNDFDYQDRRVSPANLYMEHFPYISNLWFGEMFDYNRSPDYWLVEISGIPFGLTSEMLNYRNGGNPYRGMIYGMVGRFHPSKTVLWKLWDDFGIQTAEMLGYWSPRCPVRTDDPKVLATVYRKRGESLIALARWPRQRQKRKVFARKASNAPVIDGKLAPDEWADAAKLTDFVVLDDSDHLAEQQTEVFVTFDVERLYIGFRCKGDATHLKADADRRDGATWLDDAVEVFVQPDISRRTYFQLVANSKGVFLDCEGTDRSWNGEWVCKTSTGKDFWEGEISAPFKTFGMTAPSGETTIGFNACRDQQTPTRCLSSWSPANGTFHSVASFGRVTLTTTHPSTRKQMEKKLVRDIDVRLKIDWKALGLDPARAVLIAPPIEHFQEAATFSPGDPIPVPPARGWLLIAKEKTNAASGKIDPAR